MRKIISEDKYGWPVEITQESQENQLDEAGTIKSLAGLLKALKDAGLDAEVITAEERVSYSVAVPFTRGAFDRDRDYKTKSVQRKKLKVGDKLYRLDDMQGGSRPVSRYGVETPTWDDFLKKILAHAGKQAQRSEEPEEPQLDEAVKFVGSFPKKIKDAAKEAEAKHPGSIESIEAEEQHGSGHTVYWLNLNKHTVDNEGQHTYHSEDMESLLADIQGIRPCECEECKPAEQIDEMATSRSTLKKYQALLEKPVWDKQEILGVAHQLSALHRGGKRDSMDEEFKYILHDLLSYFEDEGKRKDISADQTAQGISWLSKTVLNKQGEMRNTAVVKSAGFTQEHADIIKDFKKFELVGFKDIGSHTYAPQYAVISNAGKEFVYHVSGGFGGASIEVMKESHENEDEDDGESDESRLDAAKIALELFNISKELEKPGKRTDAEIADLERRQQEVMKQLEKHTARGNQ